MTYIPPGFDLSSFVSDLFAFGAPVVVIVGIFTVYHLIKKAGDSI